jgi:hypothetical protein
MLARVRRFAAERRETLLAMQRVQRPQRSRTTRQDAAPREKYSSPFHGLVEMTRGNFIEELGLDLGDLPDALEESLSEDEADNEIMEESDEDDLFNALRRDYSPPKSSDDGGSSDSESTYSSSDSGPSSPSSNGSDQFGDSLNDLIELLQEYFADIITGNARAVPPQLTADDMVPGTGRLVSFQMDPGRNSSHYIANVRGKSPESHVSGRHYVQLDAQELYDNPQQPKDACHLPAGYQVVILTYTREKLVGRFLKMERDLVLSWRP